MDGARGNAVLAPFADGCPGMIFQHPGSGYFHDGQQNKTPEVFLYGQTVAPARLNLEGMFNTIGVCFYPHALKSLFGFHANELTDSCVDLDLIFRRFKEELLNASSASIQFKIVSKLLHHQISRSIEADPATTFAVNKISATHGSISLSWLHEKLKISERTFQRRFEQQVGISPKLYSRVCQFQSAMKQLANSTYDNLSDVAYDNGYSDQSHFIRSFKEFSGIAPLKFKQHPQMVTGNFYIFR
jgi:AraC-like DNA-binding protein